MKIFTFNFCLSPLSKENISKLTIEIEDFLVFKDAASKALRLFNQNSTDFKLTEDLANYKVKLSKKSGLPDTDLPSKKVYLTRVDIDLNLSLATTNIKSFSFIVEDRHKVTAKPQNEQAMHRNTINDSGEADNTEMLIPKKKQSNCCLFALFSKK